MPSKVVTFGEIMMRLSPPAHRRFGQAQKFDVIYGGGEANVAVSLANFGVPVDYVTRLPENELGDACVQFLRRHGVGVDKIIRGGQRLGIYFLELGAMQRGSKVIYDRANSAIATIKRGMINWQHAFADADWFHWTGITPAISAGTADVCLEAVEVAKKMGLTVSCDLNFRSKLWNWGKTPSEVMSDLVRHCDVAIGSKEDANKVFGISAPDTDATRGQLEADKYEYVCDQLAKRFPDLNTIAITLRSSISASHNTWSGVLWVRSERSPGAEGDFYVGPTYEITHIVDRVGGGDSFMGALIYALRTYGDAWQSVLDFAVAASCLKHSIPGDFNLVTVAEVEKLMEGDASGRVSR